MSPLQLYFLIKLDALTGFFGAMGTCLIVFIIISLIAWGIMSDCNKDSGAKAKKFVSTHIKWAIPLGFIFIVLATFLPNTKEMAVIYVVPKILNNAEVQKLPNQLLTLSEEWLEKLRPENINSTTKEIVSSKIDTNKVKK
jgi:hypothetical protein